MLSGVNGFIPQFLFNTQELIIFGSALAAAGGAAFNLANARADRQISDGGVFGLARAV